MKKWLLVSVSVVVLAVAGAGSYFLSARSRPQYCWLVFGPNATVRVLVRVDGRAISMDRHRDGKFDGKEERFNRLEDCKDVVIDDADGKTSYVLTHVNDLQIQSPEKFLEVRVRIRGPVEYAQACIIKMAYEPQNAPEAYFHGPLVIGPQSWELEANGLLPKSLLPAVLQKTDKPTDLYATVNTPRPGESWVVLCSPDDQERNEAPFPQGIHPFVDVEFPPKKSGDPPIRKRYPLDRFC
jgi:hypothetical protein